MIHSTISGKILTVGLQHNNNRGGIGGVIATYARYFPVFRFLSTYPTQAQKALVIPHFIGSYLRLLLILMRHNDIRIVHIHGAAKGSFYRKFLVFLTAKYVFGRRVIYHCHGSEFKLFYAQSRPAIKRLIHQLIEGADVIICLSKQWETFFTENFRIHKLIVLGNVVEPPTMPARTDRTGEEPLRLLFLGLIGDRKGVFDLLDVLRTHKKNLSGRVHLTIGGNGDVKRLTDFIEQHQLEALVDYVGWVSGAEKQQLFRESDVYILPSYNEGLPLSILEAMSFGLPIISTPVGGTAEIVSNGTNGLLVAPGDTTALFAGIRYFIDQPARLKTMGAASAQLIQAYYPSAILPQLEKVYIDLLALDHSSSEAYSISLDNA